MLHCGCCSGLDTVQISSSRMQAFAEARRSELAEPAAVETARGLRTLKVTSQTEPQPSESPTGACAISRTLQAESLRTAGRSTTEVDSSASIEGKRVTVIVLPQMKDLDAVPSSMPKFRRSCRP